jgi:hypothetical protein
MTRNRCRASAVPDRRLTVWFSKGLKTARGKKDVASWKVSRLDGWKVVPEILADFVWILMSVWREGVTLDCGQIAAGRLQSCYRRVTAFWRLNCALACGEGLAVLWAVWKESAFYCTWQNFAFLHTAQISVVTRRFIGVQICLFNGEIWNKIVWHRKERWAPLHIAEHSHTEKCEVV